MRLSYITIQGFKSFAKKTTIDVTRQVTGVVGPNGSGKSNVAEAIRFALGEQSMKSMRGKVGPDLIFKGSERLPPLSRASVTMVIDNRDRTNIDTAHVNADVAPYLVYDELVLSRTLYADGTSDYTLNDAKVRLKDVQELLSFAGIGGSAHTIINQGEADKILLANPKERKEALEDALGLRVYHMRLSESNRKLEKVTAHLHEVELLRKEVAPHVQHLKRQVEKLESKERERKQLHLLLTAYLYREQKELQIADERIRAAGSAQALTLIATSIKKELEALAHKDISVPQGVLQKQTLQAELQTLLSRRDQLVKSIGRLEAEKAYTEKELAKEAISKEIAVQEDVLHTAYKDIKESISEVRSALSIPHIIDAQKAAERIEGKVDTFFGTFENESGKDRTKQLEEEIVRLRGEIETHEAQEIALHEETGKLQESIDSIETEAEAAIISAHEEEKKKLILESKLRELESTIALRTQEEREVSLRKERMESLQQEGVVIVGKEILDFAQNTHSEAHITMPMHDLLRAIERSKLRIEEAGIPNAAEVIAEYKTTKEREEYLTKEIADIKESETKLQSLIKELTTTLQEKFTGGVEEVSKNFTTFFAEIFDGGKAKLLLTDIVKVDEDGNETKERGVDIEVKLPSKKVQELAMFSGGERALVSIALLFAMSQVTPPPFMVLDETDAPLDEHNARKYGSMLARLAEKSKLLVITHNRETMNHCDMLYGVTIGADGASKLLSIDFKQAEVLAQ